jgi:hypothetical protein
MHLKLVFLNPSHFRIFSSVVIVFKRKNHSSLKIPVLIKNVMRPFSCHVRDYLTIYSQIHKFFSYEEREQSHCKRFEPESFHDFLFRSSTKYKLNDYQSHRDGATNKKSFKCTILSSNDPKTHVIKTDKY